MMSIVLTFKEDTVVKPGLGKRGHATVWKKGLPANIKSSPELVFRRRKCDGGGYTVPP